MEEEDIDESKMDIEALNQRQEQTKEIDALGFDQDQYEAIENEFKEFLNDHLKGKDLEKFRQEYQKINRALKSSYEGEKKLIRRCKELISQIYDKASAYRAAYRMAHNEVERISSLKQEVSKSYEEVQVLRDEEEIDRERIQKLIAEINSLKRQEQQSFELEEDKKLKNLMNEYEELEKEMQEKEEKVQLMKQKNKDVYDLREQSQTQIQNQKDEIVKLGSLITESKQKALEQEQRKKEYEMNTSKLREEIELQKTVNEEKKTAYEEMKENNKQIKNMIENKEIEIQQKKEFLRSEQIKNDHHEKNIKELQNQKRNQEVILEDKRTKRDQLKVEVDQLQKDCRKKEQLLQKSVRKCKESKEEKKNNEAARQKLKGQLELENDRYEFNKEKVDTSRKDIEQNTRQRDLLNKDVATAEEKEREQFSSIQSKENELKKLQNKITGFKAYASKLQKMIHQLEKDKQKYGIEASNANAKYYQCLEQVKLKNNLITKLQKKNIEAEGRLKQQQNLYEAVRSDRNLYSKNLLEAQEEIAELKMKFRRMTQQISQLKEEIFSKDQSIISENEKQQNYKKKNQQLGSDIEKIQRNIFSSEEMIRTQEADIARLKYVISEAVNEKAKQRKDYEMVINERDILGTQLIKRNEELALLYEKIKIQKSTLKKGEMYYQQRVNDILNIRKQIAELKKNLIVSQNETACVPDLKREIYLLQKEYLEQQTKAKYLYDELEKPFNVHRWRKLECTDPETYEMIQKIQSLQKRLIAKTEEVSEKDVLIQEKEKLYIELKNILAKQSGPEVAEKLQVYQQNLKERTNQLKEMVKELKNYQSQVNAYKFEIERLDKQIGQVKEVYFNSKHNQIIYEDMEGENQMDDMGANMDTNYMQQQQMMMQQQNQPGLYQDPPPDAQM